MSTTTISNRGERRNLVLQQGVSLFPVRHELYEDEAQTIPLDLTGYTVRGQIRKTALAATVAAEFQTRIAPTATEGWYEFWLSDEQTQAIPCGPTLQDVASRYEYDIELEDADGNVRGTFWGSVVVAAGVTRPT